MNKKRIGFGIAGAVLIALIIGFFATNVSGENFEKKVVGQWSNVPVTGGCDSNISDGFIIHDGGTIEGIEGFKEYQIEETDQDFNYLVASGGYEDIRRYEVSFNEDDLLVMQEENVSEGLARYFEKVD